MSSAYHRVPRRRSAPLVLGAVLLVVATTTCRSTPNDGASRPGATQCDEEAPGLLRISNSSGRMLDVYAARGEAQPQFLKQVSPGSSSMPVPGPADMGVRYDVFDPNARQLLATVTWLRRTAREITKGVMVELTCASNVPPGTQLQP